MRSGLRDRVMRRPRPPREAVCPVAAEESTPSPPPSPPVPATPEVIEQLVGFRSTDAPVVSLYVPVPADPGEVDGTSARVRSMLKPARELADSDDLDHYARNSLRADIALILQFPLRAVDFEGK